MMSDESENDGIYVDHYENDVYYKKYKLLLDECSQLQKSNEILVFRIQEVNEIIRRRQKEVKFFKKRLIQIYNEDWTVIPTKCLQNDNNDNDDDEERDVKYPFKTRIKEEKPDDTFEDKPKSTKKTAKRKGTKSDKDPNAPKRPSNPFFQFCQEQRQILLEQLNSELKPGEAVPTKQELTRQLAIKWKSLSGQDKQIYVDMYERSKEKYAVEMSEYKMKI